MDPVGIEPTTAALQVQLAPLVHAGPGWVRSTRKRNRWDSNPHTDDIAGLLY